MIFLSASHISKSFGGTQVLRDVTFTLQRGERVGLVGVNGSGKTTLLRIISGRDSADEGALTMPKDATVGYLTQEALSDTDCTVWEEVQSVFEPVFAMEARMRRLEEDMAHAGEDLPRLLSEYERLTHAFEEADGYAWRSSILGVLAGLSFTAAQHGQSVRSLSGGEKTRLALAKILLQKTDLLLLDEPTNHLDLSATQWLEDYLKTRYKGTVLLISHDRYFLDALCDGVIELLFGACEQYEGNYFKYLQLRQERVERRMKLFAQEQKEIDRYKAMILRYRAFATEKMIKVAKTKERMLARLEAGRTERVREEKSVHFSFFARHGTGHDVVVARRLSKGFGERALFTDLDLNVYAGDRVAIIGPNGAGKTTLLRLLIGLDKPDRGTARLGAGVEIGYYDQKQSDLHSDKTVLQEIWDDFHLESQTKIRSALGAFLFMGEDVFSPVSVLSGGERARLSLCRLMLRGDNLLVLDEPTNHLDMDSRGVLEEALDDFPGTILAVSHDRFFINRFATRVWAFEENGLMDIEGNYDDYLAARRRAFAPPEPTDSAPRNKTAERNERRQERERLAARMTLSSMLEATEAAVHDLERDIADLEVRMADPALYADPAGAAAIAAEHQQKTAALPAAYEAWEQAIYAIERGEE